MAKNELFAETDSIDSGEMVKLKGLIDTLLNLDVEVKIFDSDKFGNGMIDYQEITYEEFLNYIERIKEIKDQLQEYDDVLANEE